MSLPITAAGRSLAQHMGRLCGSAAIVVVMHLTVSASTSMADGTEPERWVGTFNASNLWRAVELVRVSDPGGGSELRIGTAREKHPLSLRSFAADDTLMTAEAEGAGVVFRMEGRIEGDRATGRLRVARGERLLTEGTWTLYRRHPSDLSADELLGRVRRALGFPGDHGQGFTIEQSAAGDTGSAPAPAWMARVGTGSRLAVEEGGATSIVVDGAAVTTVRPPFGRMPSDLRMQEKLWLAEVLRSGAWLFEEAGFLLEPARQGTGDDLRYVLALRTAAGIVPARIVIDPATWLPESADVEWDAGSRTLRFSAWKDFGGTLFPERIRDNYRGRDSEWRTLRVTPGSPAFELPAATGTASWMREASPHLEGVHGEGEAGHLFVRPTVNGKDAGWFHVDSGAPFVILDTAVADSLGLEVLRAMGSRSVRRIDELRVGQLVLKGGTALVQDLSGLSSPEGAHRAGVLGGPMFENAVVVFDYGAKRLSVYAPDMFKEEVSNWRPLTLEGGPVVEAGFGGPAGRFALDTGKAGSASLGSHSALGRGLFKGELEEAVNLTVEGETIELTTTVPLFELGGERFENPVIRIKLPGTPNDDVAGIDGFVGREFFGTRRVVFDYAGGRVAFLESPARPADR